MLVQNCHKNIKMNRSFYGIRVILWLSVCKLGDSAGELGLGGVNAGVKIF